jgi:hypothetical protein
MGHIQAKGVEHGRRMDKHLDRGRRIPGIQKRAPLPWDLRSSHSPMQEDQFPVIHLSVVVRVLKELDVLSNSPVFL